jgi:uncharacterized protein YqjF (DUF2071 family)
MNPIDRHSPTLRPEGQAVMYQSWNTLLFLHWEVDPEPLARLLPPGVELDTYEGKAYVGLVPFTMTGVRPRRLPAVSWLSNFHETNVRTYVHCRNANPGVWFFSLDAANAIAVGLARKWFHLPYYYAGMSLSKDSSGWITYRSARRFSNGRPAGCHVVARPVGEVEPARLGSLEHFLAERYILYASRGRGLALGRVHHSPYPLQRAEVLSVEETLLAAAGIARPETAPLAHFASGVRVDVFGLENVSLDPR